MLPIYEVECGDLTAISLVRKPAIEEDFMLFKEQKELKLSFDDEKHIVFGPAIIADKPIYRVDGEGREYYVVFTAEVIEKLFTNFMKNGGYFNLEHSKETNDVFLIESFIKRPGLNPVGFEGVSDGSWFISLKVENEALWADLKAGKYNGFSIECFVDLEKKDDINNLIDELLK